MNLINKIKTFFQTSEIKNNSASSDSPIQNANEEDKTIQNFENDPKYIKVFDAFGREYFLTKEKWRTEVLPNQLKTSWNNPNDLYGNIVYALQDAFFEDILIAAERLVEIDSDSERSTTILGIVLMKLGKLDESERILTEYINKYGESGVILVNIAKIYAEKNNHDESEKNLKHALEIDPNLDNALLWLMTIENERGGEKAIKKILDEYSKIQNSWNPQLWLARYALESKDIALAKKYYQHVLSQSILSDRVLTMITGDLGKNGYIQEAIELVSAYYLPEKHGYNCGFNLLQAYLEKKDWENGLVLVHKMQLQNWPPFNVRLMQYANEFDKLKPDLNQNEETDIEKLQVSAFCFDQPIWLYNLKNPKWLYQLKSDSSPKIIIMPLSGINSIKKINKPYIHRENDLGKLARGIALFLTEKIYFMTKARPLNYIFAFENKGVILYSYEFDWESISAVIKNTNADIAITGEIIESENQYELKLHLWDVKQKQKVVTISRNFPQEQLSANLVSLLDNLESELQKVFNIKFELPKAYYTLPLDKIIVEYIEGLAQALTLALIENNKETLWGERNIYEWFISLIQSDEKSIVSKIILASVLAKGMSFGSEIPKEFEKRLSVLFEKDKNLNSEFALLEPYLMKIFGNTNEFEQLVAEYLKIDNKDYKEWLESIKQ